MTDCSYFWLFSEMASSSILALINVAFLHASFQLDVLNTLSERVFTYFYLLVVYPWACCARSSLSSPAWTCSSGCWFHDPPGMSCIVVTFTFLSHHPCAIWDYNPDAFDLFIRNLGKKEDMLVRIHLPLSSSLFSWYFI